MIVALLAAQVLALITGAVLCLLLVVLLPLLRRTLGGALRAITDRRRRGRGLEDPTAAELLAYRDGLLGEAEREEVEEKIAAFPEAARALADLAAFPDVEPPPGVAPLSEEELEASWQRFRLRLGLHGDPTSERSSLAIEAVDPAVVCAWCPGPGSDMDSASVSHGICAVCAEIMLGMDPDAGPWRAHRTGVLVGLGLLQDCGSDGKKKIEKGLDTGPGYDTVCREKGEKDE